MKIYKINEFSRLIGRSVRTLQRWDVEGVLVAHRNPKDRRYYTHDQYLKYIGIKADDSKKIIVYSRVSSANQKNDLDSQKKALEKYCQAKGYCIDTWINEIGSGLNYQAALSYLKASYSEFHDWKRAVIAYEIGKNNTEQLINTAQSRDAWVLARSPSAPKDLKKFLSMFEASVIIMHNPELVTK